MYEYKKFDVDVARRVAPDQLGWPAPGDAADDRSLGGNRDYLDLRRLTWSEADTAYAEEEQLIKRIEEADDPEAEYEEIEEENVEEPNGLYGLDIGVASTVFALSANGCIPVSSCNGGAFGGWHHERHSLVAFFARPWMVDVLLECAQEAGAGLENQEMGVIVAYAGDIRPMRAFARALKERRSIFRDLRPVRQGKSTAGKGKQLKLL